MGQTAAPDKVNPQQLLWQKTYKDIKSHTDLDSSYEKLRLAIEQRVSLLQRQTQVRVKNWLKKLSEETANAVWKRNRNAFAKLLLEQLRAGRLAEPFHQLPPDGPLPTLPKHAAYAFAQSRSPSWQQRERRPSASEALDEYLGRQDFRQLQLGSEPAQRLVQPLAAAAAPAAADVLPGTRMQLVGDEARRVDRFQLQDTECWQPSKLELEAQLGASRERERELQWRLRQAEETLQRQGALLERAVQPAPLRLEDPVPLSVLDDAIDEEDGHVSPPRRRISRRELGELIEKYEERRRQWSIPAWPRQGKGAGRVSPLPDGEEEEILEHLDNFQRQTEAIRRHLSRRTASSSGDSGPATSLAAGLSSLSNLDPEPTVSTAPPALEPLFSPAGSTMVDGGGPTPMSRGTLPQGLLATAARPTRLGGLFEGLPGSSRFGAARPGQQQRGASSQQQQPAVSAASTWAGEGASTAPPMAPGPSSPVVRHTLKSAAAAQKNSALRGSPRGSSGRPAANQEQQRQQVQEGRARGGEGKGEGAASDARTHATQTSGPSRQQQQPAQTDSEWQQRWDAIEASIGGAPRRPSGGGTQLAGSAAGPGLDLFGNAAAPADEDPALDPLASTSRAPFRRGGGMSRNFLQEQSSSDLDEGGPRQHVWQVSQRHRLTDEDSGEQWATPLSTTLLAGGESSGGEAGGGGGRGLARGLGLASSDASLEDFRRQTENIKAQIAALRLLDD